MLPRRFAVYTALAFALSAPLGCAATTAPHARAAASAEPAISAQDQAFLSARDAARLGNRERLAQLAAQLTAHPLASYVEYWQLALRLRQDDPAVASDVEAFFARHANTYIADRLRLDWALALAARDDFTGFDRESAKLVWNTDDGQLRCFIALSRYRTAAGQQAEAQAREARQLLANTRDSAGEGCLALTEALLADGRISAWERVRALVEQNQFATAKRIGARALDANGAIVRLARDNPQDAAEYANSLNLLFTPEQRGIVWGRIGHMAALKLMPEANQWYRRGGEHVGVGSDAARVTEVLEWQVRAALRTGDWATVARTIDRMPTSLGNDPAWVYWRGRALQKEGRVSEAQEHFQRISGQFHFYGKLAAEELGQPIVLPPRAPPPTAEDIEALRLNVGFARALKFYDLGLRVEGHREWNWQLRGMTDPQLLAAAEFARSRGLLDRMINTSDRTQAEYDFTQRFPSPFREAMVQYSAPRTGSTA